MDYTLYLVTDRRLMSTKTLQEAVKQAISGGCTMIQLREKDISSLDFFNLARDIKLVTDRCHIPLIINDRIDIALSINAAGVHIGQSDVPTRAVRKIIGKDMILGVSACCIGEALQAQKDGADYIGVGAMFPTKTKTDAQIVSIEELRHIRRAVSLPIVAIGGVDTENAAILRNAGADGLAVVSAILSQPDIKAAARELRHCFEKEGVC